MAKHNRRLRKKLHLGEFQELGFSVNWAFAEGTSKEKINEVVDRFIKDGVEANGLLFEGYGLLNWEGIICLREIGHCTAEHQQMISKWLEKEGLQDIKISEIYDIWWD